MLKPYHKDTEDSDRGKSSRAPTGIRIEFNKETKEIIENRTVREANNHQRLEYFVSGRDCPIARAVGNRHELFDSSRT